MSRDREKACGTKLKRIRVMMKSPQKINESIIEETTLAWFEKLDYSVASTPAITPDTLPHKHHNQTIPEANNP